MVCDWRCLPGAPLGITVAVPSCCFVFFLYPFSTSTAVLKLTVNEKEKKKNTTTYQARYLFGLDDHSISQP